MARLQLLALGFSSQAIKTLVSRGRLHKLHRAVYAVGHKRLTAKGRWMAAVLACGKGAVLSHHDAAALYDLRQVGSGKIDITAASHHKLAGIRSHWARTLAADDCTVVDAIPVTSLARTYLDLSEVLSHSRLVDVLEAGQRQNKLDVGALQATIKRNHGRHGIDALTAAITELGDEPPLLQSPREQAFRALIRDHHLPQPQFNAYVEGELVDAVWAQHRLVVEVDGFRFHLSKRSFSNDRERDRKLVRAGWRVIRFTGDDVADRPDEVAAEISELLRDGPWPPPGKSGP